MQKLTAEQKTERRALRRRVKKDGNRIGFSLIWYFVINIVVVAVWMIVEMEMAAKGITDPVEAQRIMDEVAEKSEISGASMIAGVLIGLGFLFLFLRKTGAHRRLFHREESITPKKFAGIACVFLGTQLVFNGMYALMEAGLNLMGYSAMSSMEMATSGSMTLSMFIYAGIVGPIVEELIFRGLILRSLEGYGRNLAIVVSSLLFGVMHGNIPQMVFAFLTGLILGYAASRYSIVWCIILHIFNNLVLGDLLSRALSGLSEDAQALITLGIMGIFTVAGLVVLIVRRKDILGYIRQNRSQKPNLRWIITCAGISIYVLMNIGIGVSMLEKI